MVVVVCPSIPILNAKRCSYMTGNNFAYQIGKENFINGKRGTYDDNTKRLRNTDRCKLGCVTDI